MFIEHHFKLFDVNKNNDDFYSINGVVILPPETKIWVEDNNRTEINFSIILLAFKEGQLKGANTDWTASIQA